MLKKHFSLSALKAVVLLNNFEEAKVYVIWWTESSEEQRFQIEIFCNMNYFTVTLDQFNTSLLNKSNDIYSLAFIAKQYLTTVMRLTSCI